MEASPPYSKLDEPVSSDHVEVFACHRLSDGEQLGVLHRSSRINHGAQQIHTILEHMTREGFDVQRVSWDGGVAVNIFENHEIDVVLCDGVDMLEFGRAIIRRNPLIDVLLYDIETKPAGHRADLSVYTAIYTHPDIGFALAAIDMIEDHRRKWNDMIFLRGMVISKAVEVEGRLNDVIAAYFRLDGERAEHFVELVLENPMYTLEGKKQTIRSILEREDLKGEWKGMDTALSMIQKNRNKLAHCEPDPDDPGRITTMNRSYEYGRKLMREIFADARLVLRRLDHIQRLLESR